MIRSGSASGLPFSVALFFARDGKDLTLSSEQSSFRAFSKPTKAIHEHT
jgi:hypothetical protein